MMLNALSFEQIITIMHNIEYCERACYKAINSNNAINGICMAFDELTEAIKSIADKDDWREWREIYVSNLHKRLDKLDEED